MAKIVTPAEVVEGATHIRGGAIRDILPGPLESAAAVDIEEGLDLFAGKGGGWNAL
jgi:hypothetical protein